LKKRLNKLNLFIFKFLSFSRRLKIFHIIVENALIQTLLMLLKLKNEVLLNLMQTQWIINLIW